MANTDYKANHQVATCVLGSQSQTSTPHQHTLSIAVTNGMPTFFNGYSRDAVSARIVESCGVSGKSRSWTETCTKDWDPRLQSLLRGTATREADGLFKTENWVMTV